MSIHKVILESKGKEINVILPRIEELKIDVELKFGDVIERIDSKYVNDKDGEIYKEYWDEKIICDINSNDDVTPTATYNEVLTEKQKFLDIIDNIYKDEKYLSRNVNMIRTKVNGFFALRSVYNLISSATVVYPNMYGAGESYNTFTLRFRVKDDKTCELILEDTVLDVWNIK